MFTFRASLGVCTCPVCLCVCIYFVSVYSNSHRVRSHPGSPRWFRCSETSARPRREEVVDTTERCVRRTCVRTPFIKSMAHPTLTDHSSPNIRVRGSPGMFLRSISEPCHSLIQARISPSVIVNSASTVSIFLISHCFFFFLTAPVLLSSSSSFRFNW